ncbi:hypothetical protein GCM10010310_63010 [Streptomyces violaceolatus]|uniref:Uncharacterized protein n=1 Tax=Streptomyces violaceolatus TaxID=67378 RepID=A0ABN3TBM3_9ACTN
MPGWCLPWKDDRPEPTEDSGVSPAGAAVACPARAPAVPSTTPVAPAVPSSRRRDTTAAPLVRGGVPGSRGVLSGAAGVGCSDMAGANQSATSQHDVGWWRTAGVA